MAVDIRTILENGLLLLLNSKRPLDKITVTEILKETGVGRRTFYAYFSDKNDLIQWIYSEKIVQSAMSQNSGQYYLKTKEYYDLLLKYRHLIMQACLLNDQNCLKDSMYAFAKDELVRIAGVSHNSDSYYACTYHAHAMTDMCLEWIYEGMQTSTDEILKRITASGNMCLDNLYNIKK